MKVSLKKTKKISIHWILNMVTALFLILNCQSVWQRAYNNNFHIYEICFLMIIIDSFYYIGHWGISRSSKNKLLFFSAIYLVVIFLVVLLSVSNTDLVRFLSRFLIYPFFLLYFFSSAPIKCKIEIFKCFVDWMAVISWITFVFWGLSSFEILKPSGTFEIDWGGNIVLYNYHNLYYSSPQQYIDWIGHGIRRNIGIFVEGPMFMLTLILALLFCLIIGKLLELYWHLFQQLL